MQRSIGRLSGRKFQLAFLAFVAMVAIVRTPFAVAGTQAASAAPPDSENQIAEIIVTAQKRQEGLQTVPVSVAVVQGQALEEQNNNTLQDLAQILPAVHIVNTGGYSNSLNIRGIGSGAGNPAFDQSVATFEDDIYYGRSRMIQATFLDVDRIEVLKGPQSTFFGNNAIAGALNIVTKGPDDQFDGYARALYGMYGQYAVEGAVGGPINDMFGVRVAGIMDGDNGWIRNVDTGGLAPIERNGVGRITAAFKPVEEFTATLKVEAGHNKTEGTTSNTPYQWDNCPPAAPLKTSAVNAFCPYAIAAGAPLGLGNNLNAGLAGQYAILDTHTEVLTMNYLKWGHTFTSVTGDYGYRFTEDKDQANAGPFLSTITAAEDYHQVSQEFRITSPLGQQLEYMAGVYYQQDDINELVDGNAPYVSPLLAEFGFPAEFLPIGYDVGYGQRESVESVFGSLRWNITDQLRINTGVRATADHKSFEGVIGYGKGTDTYGGLIPYPAALANAASVFLGPPGSYPYTRTDKALMPSAGIQYQIAPQAMSYFTYSRGFKAGGYNAIAPSPIGGANGAEPTFGPETVNSYELGLKSKWIDNRLLLNFDVFREDYTGLQINALTAVTSITYDIAVRNAANSVSQGAELETQWVVSDNVRLSADITYLDAYYKNFANAAPTVLQTQDGVKSQDLSGAPLDFASKWSGSVTAEYRANLAANYRLISDLSPFFQSQYFNSNGTDDPNDLIKASIRLDAKLTLEQTSQNWAIDLIGKNLTDRVIVVLPSSNEVPGGKQEPRTVAIQGRYKF